MNGIFKGTFLLITDGSERDFSNGHIRWWNINIEGAYINIFRFEEESKDGQ